MSRNQEMGKDRVEGRDGGPGVKSNVIANLRGL